MFIVVFMLCCSLVLLTRALVATTALPEPTRMGVGLLLALMIINVLVLGDCLEKLL